jgi:hypothetical protein
MHASGTAEKVKLSEQALAVAEMVRPKLVHDGLSLSVSILSSTRYLRSTSPHRAAA